MISYADSDGHRYAVDGGPTRRCIYQHAQGAIEADLWLGFHNMLQRDLKVTGFAASWDSQRNIFSPEFQRYVEELRK